MNVSFRHLFSSQESSNLNCQDSLSPINHPVNTNDDLDDFLLGELDPESFAFTPPHLVLSPETETLLFDRYFGDINSSLPLSFFCFFYR